MINWKSSWIKWFCIWLAALSIGLYFRMYPLLYRSSDDSSEKASVIVMTKLRASIAQSINTNYPNLSKPARAELIQRQFNEIVHKQKDKVRESIQTLSKDMDKGRSQTFQPYLLASDSFYFLYLTQNIIDSGNIASVFKGSKFLNPLTNAPFGEWEPISWHAFSGFFVYKMFQWFQPNVDLMYAVSFTPLFLTAIILILFLWVCRVLRLRTIAVFTGSVFFLLAPIFIKRSAFGWYDNDAYNIIFPLLLLGILFEALDSQKLEAIPDASSLRNSFRRSRLVGLAILGGLATTLYAFYWQGWMFFFTVLMLAGGACCFFAFFFLKNYQKLVGLIFGLWAVTTLLGVSLVFGPKDFYLLFAEGLDALAKFTQPQMALWPDLYIAVGELKKSSFNDIIEQTGGILPFAGATITLLLGFVLLLRKESSRALHLIILGTYFLLALVLTLGAQRFALLCLTPVALLFTLGCSDVLNKIRNSKAPGTKSMALAHLLVIGTLFFPIRHAVATTPSLFNFIFNQVWDEALTDVKLKTPPEAIITTWWPPGHFIKSIAQRRVAFDGASIGSRQSYWIANVMLSTDERESVGILRMLNTSGNQAAEYLQKSGLPLSKTAQVIRHIVSMPQAQARKELSAAFEPEIIGKLIEDTHGKMPPPSYLLIYNELMEKNLQLSFVANWDFAKVEAFNAQNKAKLPARGSKEFISLLWDIAGRPLRYSGILPKKLIQNDIVIFSDDIAVDIKQKTCTIHSQQYGRGVPEYLVYTTSNDVVYKRLENATLAYSVVLIEKNGNYECALMDTSLAQSMLVRMYFFKGRGLKYFKPLTSKEDLTGRTRVDVFEVDWNAYLRDMN